jgi:hypothetical protein
MPIGNYNVNSLALTLTSILNLLSPNGYTYQILYPNSYTSGNTNKYTFLCSNTTSSISFTFGVNSLFQQMGFNKNSINNFTNGSLISINSLNISYINRVFLKSNCCNTSQDSILQELLVVGSFPTSSYIYWENLHFDTTSKEYTLQNDNSLQFQLFDRYGQIVDLNGQDMVFSVTFYKKNSTDEIHQNHIQLKNLEKITNK